MTEAFELVHESYLNAGLVQPNGSDLRVTPHQLLSTTEVFVTKYEGQVVSTVSLIGDGELGLPLESIYTREIDSFRERGLKMAEIGCLADRRESPVRFIETFATMGRSLAKVAMDRGYDGLIAAAHPKHTRLYRRILPFEQIGDVTQCPYANGNPAAMIFLTFEQHRGTSIYDRFFGQLGEAIDISPRPWSKETRAHFQQFVDHQV